MILNYINFVVFKDVKEIIEMNDIVVFSATALSMKFQNQST